VGEIKRVYMHLGYANMHGMAAQMAAQWDDLKTVMQLVRGRSLAAAALALGVNYTTVARRVARAEEALGVTLFERLADGYHPTEAGETVARHAAEMEAQEFDLLRALGQQSSALSGRLVVTAPELLCSTLLPQVFDDFCTRHPDIELEVRAGTDMLDLNRREADLAIRVSDDPGNQLTGVRLAAQDTASFATQDWADRIAADPGAQIDWVVYSKPGAVPQASLENFPNARVKLRFNDMIAMAGAARAGLGVVRMPMFLGRTYSELVQVPVLAPQSYTDIWVVSHRDVWPTARVQAFRDCLVPYFKENRAIFVA